MKVGIIGSGGREHALCLALKKSKKIVKIYCIPGNAGTNFIAENVYLNVNDFEGIKDFVLKEKIDLVIVGPEKPLVDGIVDFLERHKIKVFGPNKVASQLEGSKIFTKKLCKKFNIPTAKFGIFQNKNDSIKFLENSKFPIVIKADNLASGKGVYICDEKNAAKIAIDEIFDVQDAIIERIVSVIVGSVERDQVKKLANAKPENLQAYDFVLQGLEYHRRSSLNAENNKKALSFFNKAIEADPNYARAHAWKTCSLANNAEWFQEEMPDGWMDEALASVNKAMDLDPNDPEAHRIMGAIKLLFEGDMEKAIFHHEKAIEICPSDTYHISRYAVLLCYLGQPEKGLVQIEKALRLDPFCSDLVLETQGLCLYLLRQHEEALSTFKKMQIETRTSLFYGAACNQALANHDIAKQMLKMAISESEMTIEKFVSTQLFQEKQTSEELTEVLNSI